MDRSDKELLEWLLNKVKESMDQNWQSFLCTLINSSGYLELGYDSCVRLMSIIRSNRNLAGEYGARLVGSAWWEWNDYDNRIAFLNELIKREEEK